MTSFNPYIAALAACITLAAWAYDNFRRSK